MIFETRSRLDTQTRIWSHAPCSPSTAVLLFCERSHLQRWTTVPRVGFSGQKGRITGFRHADSAQFHHAFKGCAARKSWFVHETPTPGVRHIESPQDCTDRVFAPSQRSTSDP